MTTNFINTSSVFPTGQTVNRTLAAGTNGQLLQVDTTNPTGFSFTSQDNAYVTADNLTTMPAVVQPAGITNTVVILTQNTFYVQFQAPPPQNATTLANQTLYNAIVVGGKLSAKNGTGSFGTGLVLVTSKDMVTIGFLNVAYRVYGTFEPGTGFQAGSVTELAQGTYEDIRSPLVSNLDVGNTSIVSSTGNVTINPLSDVIDVTSSKISNCLDPTAAQDVATKNYTDTQLNANALASTDLTWSRTIFTDNLASSSPVIDTDAFQSIQLPSGSDFTIFLGSGASALAFWNAVVYGSRVTATAGTGTIGNELLLITFKTTLGSAPTIYIIQGTRAAGSGAVAGSISNTTQQPYVSIKSPLNSALNVGSQSITSSTGNVTINPSSDIIDVTSSKISNCLDPTAAQDVATKNYVDTTAASVAASAAAAAVATPASNINMTSTYRVTNMPAPSAGGDATNKTYVDALVADAAITTYTNANARNAAVTSPTAFDWTYLRVPNVLQYYDTDGWKNYGSGNLGYFPPNIYFDISFVAQPPNTTNITYYSADGATSSASPIPGGTVAYAFISTSAGTTSFRLVLKNKTTNGIVNPSSAYRNIPVEYLVVGGGGGGGGTLTSASLSAGGAGGGGGGVLTGMSVMAVSGSLGDFTFTANVGTGGAAGTSASSIAARGQSGNNSTLTIGSTTSTTTFTAIGGGGGGTSTLFQLGGASGGSGGGAASTGVPGNGTAGQGFAGGSSTSQFFSGGGGGATSIGGFIEGISSVGGTALTSYINPALFTLFGAGGGAASGFGGGAVPNSGGGNGGNLGGNLQTATSGTNGSGGGGGGGQYQATGNGGAGGTGIIIIRFPYDTPPEPSLSGSSVISIYSDSTARSAAIPTPYVGQFTFLTGTSLLQYFQNSIWNTYPPGAVGPTQNIVTVDASASPQQPWQNFSTGFYRYLDASGNVSSIPVSNGTTVMWLGGITQSTGVTGTLTANKQIPFQYIVCGGGGGGGYNFPQFSINPGGGGGGGGVLIGSSQFLANIAYNFQVGRAGTYPGSYTFYSAATDSILNCDSGTLTAVRGGAGCINGNFSANENGGSGGGASVSAFAGLSIAPGQGNNGGPYDAPTTVCGGGGGYTTAGNPGGNIGGGGDGYDITYFFGPALGMTIGVGPIAAGGGGGAFNTNGGARGSGVAGRGGGINGSAVSPLYLSTGCGGGGAQGQSGLNGAIGSAGMIGIRYASFS